jgi:hypothetical protein
MKDSHKLGLAWLKGKNYLCFFVPYFDKWKKTRGYQVLLHFPVTQKVG